MKKLFALVVIALSGCAVNTTNSSPRSVTIDADLFFTSFADVTKQAEAECQKYGRHAVFNSGGKRIHIFNCVE